MKPPKIDDRNIDSLIKQMEEMVVHYTPEWRFTPESPDPGTALFLIFAQMFNGNIERFNRIPHKNFIAFLNMLDISLVTAHPAKSYVTFLLNENVRESIMVTKGTKLSAPSNDERNEVIFETLQGALITPAKINGIYNVSPKRDLILDYSDHQSLHLFHTNIEDNIQEHCLYISHDNLLTVIHSAIIDIELTHSLKKYQEQMMAKQLVEPEHVEWSYSTKDGWEPFDVATYKDNHIILYKKKVKEIEPIKVNEIEEKWIKCKVKSIKADDETFKYKNIEIDTLDINTTFLNNGFNYGFKPDMLFLNDIQIDTLESFHPFGEQFNTYDSFYLSSKEAFTKKGSIVSIKFDLSWKQYDEKMAKDPDINWKLIMKEEDLKESGAQNISVVKVLWEYWDGNSWVSLVQNREYNEMFYFHKNEDEKITIDLNFICPNNLSETFVNSQYNYWIRARVLKVNNIIATKIRYQAPWIENIGLDYRYESNERFPLEKCITLNNMEHIDYTELIKAERNIMQPFYGVVHKEPAVYFGFDQAPKKGPINLLFAIEEKNTVPDQKPIVEWEYLCYENRSYKWKTLKIIDETQSFIQSGNIQFYGPDDIANKTIFNKDLFWIRMVNKDYYFENLKNKYDLPFVKGYYLNTIKVLQQESITQEAPEYFETVDEQYFKVGNTPILKADVWVDETGLTEEEIERLQSEENFEVDILRDSDGNIMSCWIKWESVKNFLKSNATNRHYILDHVLGKLIFGDGINGKKPPTLNSHHIRVDYTYGGGKIGNVDAKEISVLQSPIPFVENVFNPVPASGGSDLELIDKALVRGPQIVKHRNRAVTAKDFEWLARQAAPNLAKVKCLPNINSQMEKELGCVTLVIFPEGGEKELLFFSEIRNRVETYLINHTTSTLSFPGKINVIKPVFLEVSLFAELAVYHMEEIVPTELDAVVKLNTFLDPLKGNYNGMGWDIGEYLHVSVFYSLLKSIHTVNHIEKLYMTVVKVENGIRTEMDINEIEKIRHGIISNGTHKVNVILV